MILLGGCFPELAEAIQIQPFNLLPALVEHVGTTMRPADCWLADTRQHGNFLLAESSPQQGLEHLLNGHREHRKIHK